MAPPSELRIPSWRGSPCSGRDRHAHESRGGWWVWRQSVPEGLGCPEGVLEEEEFDLRSRGESVLDTGNSSQ